MNIFKRIIYFLIRVFYKLKCKKIKLYHGVRIKPGSKFHGHNKIGPNSFFFGEMGRFSYIGSNSTIKGKIGNFCSISHNVMFLTGVHPTQKFVSTHPSFYSLAKQCGTTFVKEQKFNEVPKLENSDFSIEIGNDVLIGEGATIIGPIRIGNGAVIGAHSVVTRDVGSYEVVVGCPARIIRKRFTEEQIAFLENSEWWNRSEQWLLKHADLFTDIDAFIKSIGNEQGF